MQLSNFESTMEILSGLSLSCVSRLKYTWKEVGETYQEKFDAVRELCQRFLDPSLLFLIQKQFSSSNFKKLRETIEKLAKERSPHVPFLGLYLSDIAKTVEAVPSTVDGKINFSKYRVIASILKKIRTSQRESFPFEPIEALQQVINDQSVRTQIECRKTRLE